MSVLHVLVILLCMNQVLYFLRIDRQFAQLVQLIKDCTYQMSIFLIFYCIILVFFSLIAQALGSEVDNEEYLNLNTFWIFLIQATRNSIGDLAVPTYEYW